MINAFYFKKIAFFELLHLIKKLPKFAMLTNTTTRKREKDRKIER